MKTYTYFNSFVKNGFVGLLFSVMITTGLSAQNEWTVSVWSNGWGDATTWMLVDSTGTVILSGGTYGNGFLDVQTVETTKEPLTFHLTATLGDNLPGYSVECDGAVVVGQIEPGPWQNFTVTCSNLFCGIQTCVPSPMITMSGNVFFDNDCNGEMGPEESEIPGIGVFRNNSLLAFSNSAGNYSGIFSFDDDDNIIGIQELPGFTTNQHIIPADSSILQYANIDFALCPQSGFVNLGAGISPIGLPPRPGFNHSYSLCVQNMGSLPCDSYEVVLDFSNLPGVTVVNDAGGVVSGTQITWMLNDLGVFEQNCFTVTFNVPPGTPQGTVMNPIMHVNAQPDPSLDPYLHDNSHSYTHFVVAAYDPNDKTVSQPIVNYTEIEPGEGAELEYLIRFQNTGNFFATFVRVEDVLPDLLDLNTLEMIHASHDYEIIIHEEQHIEWFFDNIMLPDSTSDEPGSHGHIHFRIKTVPDVQLEDVIENFASIFFDFKEPVITEPAITTFLDCSEGSLSIVVNESVCTGVPFTLTSNRNDFNDYQWLVNGQSLNGEEVIFTSNEESVSVELTTINPVCTLSATLEIPLIPAPSIDFTMEGFVVCGLDVPLELSATGSVSWFLNDELVAQGHSVVLEESGMYTLVAENECGVFEITTPVQIVDLPEEVVLTFDGEQLVVSPEGTGYVWILGGFPISTEGPAYTPTESGDYSVIVYFENSMCSQTSNLVFVPVSVNELLDAQIKLYPNPAKDMVTIELPRGQWQLNLMDAVGKNLRSVENVTESRFDLELRGIAPGAYFVQVSSDEGFVVKKLVVR